MIIKLALLKVEKMPKSVEPVAQQLENENKVVHVSRPANGNKMKTPVRVFDIPSK